MRNELIALKLLMDNIQIRIIDPIYEGSPIPHDVYKSPRLASLGFYLCQELWVNLGYDYKWASKMGPVSPNFIYAFYELESELESQTTEDFCLRSDVIAKIDITPKIRRPDGIAEEQWLTLLVSMHYLYVTSKFETEDVDKTLYELGFSPKALVDARETLLGISNQGFQLLVCDQDQAQPA